MKDRPVAQPLQTMGDVWEAYRKDLEEVEDQVRLNLDSHVPLINTVCSHILSSGGKRIRPLLLILCARLFGYIHKEDLVLGSLIEFIHTATLLHDDVLDDADLRRGQETARRVWGNHASILVGDYLYSRAMSQIAAFRNHGFNETLAEACRKMAEGEILQLEANDQTSMTEDEYLRIVEYKTAALIAASCKVGGIIGGASPSQQATLYRFGLHLGIAFQLADDRLDYTANGDRLGKTLGQDLRQGMVTLPLLHLLQTCSEGEKQRITQQIRMKNLGEEDLSHIISLMHQYSSLTYAMARAQEFVDAASLDLASFDDSTAKRALIIVACYMMNRDC